MTEQFMSVQPNDQANKATRLILTLLIANNVLLVILIVLAWRVPTWQIAASIAASVFLTSVFIVSNRMIRRGSVIRAVQIAIYAVIFVVGLNGIWFAGLGLAFAIGLAMVVFQMSSLVLDFRQSTQVLVVSILVGLVMIGVDNINLSFRLFFAPLTAVIPTIAVLLALAFAVQVFRSLNQYGLRGKMVVTTVFVATVAVVIVAVGVQAVTRRTLIQEVGENVKTQADALGTLVGELIFRQIDTMQSFALGRELNDELVAQNERYEDSRSVIVLHLIEQNEGWVNLGDDDEVVQAILHNPMAEELAKFQQQFPEFQQAVITDQYGAIAAANDRPAQLFVGSEEWWRTAYANGDGRIFIQLAVDDSSPVRGVRMAVPIYDTATNQVVGVLSSIVGLDALTDVLQAFQLSESDKIELNFPGSIALDITSNGEIAFKNSEEGDLDLYAAIAESEDSFVQTTVADQAVIGSIGRTQTLAHMPIIDALDWEVAVFREQADVFSSIETQQNLNILLGAVVVVIAAAAAAFVGQRLAEPILRLKETAVRVQGGDLTARAVKLSDDEVGELAAAFNDMTDQLSETLQGLEARVAERTRVIEISAQVSRNLSTILDRKQLVQAVVTQVQSAFNYYYAQIYLWDEHKKQLVLAGGTGEIGSELLDQGHALELSSGPVGRAAETKLPVLITDITRDPSWFPTALLPDTKSEAAVPIFIGEAVIGVLDVQHTQAEGLGEQDVELIQSVANQFAIAYQNARNYENQQKQAHYEGRINEIRSRIQQTRDVDSALKVAVRELADALGASRAKVQLYHNEGNGRDTLQE
ncbi:MAG: GAF domain-containing protein [Anaerolineales bacterium]|nr:GAF domain-containing protein [Anaerolineales bacterium]